MAPLSSPSPLNPDAVRRVETDEQLARDAGLAFKQPTLYVHGTPVMPGAYQASRKEFDARALAMDEAKIAYETVAKQDRRDIDAPIPDVSMLDTGMVQRVNGKPLPISPWALSQLLDRAGAPGGAGRYLSECPVAMRQDHTNHWLPRAYGVVRDDKGNVTGLDRSKPIRATFRTMLDGTGETARRGIYAVVSPRYQAHDAPECIRALLKDAHPSARGEFVCEGARWRFTLHFHSDFQADGVVVGDIFRGAVWISGRDDGGGAIRVGVGVERARCINLTTIWAKDVQGIRHNAKEIADKLSALIGQGHKRIDGFASKWAEASRDNIIDGVYEGAPPNYIFGELVRKGLVSAPNLDGGRDELIARLVRAWDQEPGYTRADIVNAITRAAHTETWQSPWVTEAIEEQAGQLLYNYVHIAPPEATSNGEGSRFAGLEV